MTTAVEWPNLFVVGAAKAGTTSLWRYLGEHPEIYMSPVKEPHFFTSFSPVLVPAVKDAQAYLRLFDRAGAAKLRGEASPSYLHDPDSPQAIKRVRPDAKIVIALRDPVDRAYAFYWTGVKYGGKVKPFLEFIEGELALPEAERPSTLCVGYSLYADGVMRYLGAFDGNVHVLFFEELAQDARGELRRLFAFLDVEPDLADRVKLERHNSFAMPRNELTRRFLVARPLRQAARSLVPAALRPRVESVFLSSTPRPPMDPEARRLLEDAFAEDRARLADILGRPLPW